ncbi:MFS transporter [Salinicoccus roseus]|uniref:MFS transporter n=1 Tax=Salinicoccus roseus TaxID=45670 RepID=UPI000F4F689F|nr:MFS transporter [Salinicoccus roseus]RPE55071.1 putative MFS family arabinose efflux permease [Salinicoccus roseus]GGA60311.1 MFS transporter [Salinicoccus roseus]
MSDTKQKIWTKDFILIVIVNFFIFTAFQMTLPTLPLFVQEIGASDRWIGIVVGIFTFSALLIRPSAGKLLDTKGRAPVFLTGLALFVISMFSLAASFTILMLLMVRIIQGVGWGLSSTSAGTIATDLVPKKRRGEGLGYYGLSGNIALAFGPALGLFLVNHISFTMLFAICGLLGLTAIILAANIKYDKPEKVADTRKQKESYPHFDIVERRALAPASLLFFITVTFGGIATFLPVYTYEKGFDSTYIQFYFVIYAAFLMLSRILAGRLYDRHGITIVFIPGSLSIIAAMILLGFLPAPIFLFVAAALYGFGFGCVQPALQAWAVNRVENNRRGMANATFFSAFDLGVGLGAISYGFVAEAFGYSTIYFSSAVSVTVALILFLFIMRRYRKDTMDTAKIS